MIQALKSKSGQVCNQVIARICGGLGNQMFQYAAGRATALRLGAELKLDLSFYDRRRHRQFELDRFPIQARWNRGHGGFRGAQRLVDSIQRLGRPRPVYQEPSKRFDPQFHHLNCPVELHGYFFSEQYFVDQAEPIRGELQPPAATDRDSVDLQARIAGDESTALHVRRGDYVTNKKANERFWSCTLDYYQQALERIESNGSVFVFSDDIKWARENLPAVKPLVFVDSDPHGDGLRDMWLMSHAHHHVIANSSFSWWGAWLAGPEKGLTIAPARWFNDPSIDDVDMVPPQWIRI